MYKSKGCEDGDRGGDCIGVFEVSFVWGWVQSEKVGVCVETCVETIAANVKLSRLMELRDGKGGVKPRVRVLGVKIGAGEEKSGVG